MINKKNKKMKKINSEDSSQLNNENNKEIEVIYVGKNDDFSKGLFTMYLLGDIRNRELQRENEDLRRQMDLQRKDDDLRREIECNKAFLEDAKDFMDRNCNFWQSILNNYTGTKEYLWIEPWLEWAANFITVLRNQLRNVVDSSFSQKERNKFIKLAEEYVHLTKEFQMKL